MASAGGTGTPGESGVRPVCGIRLRNATVSYRRCPGSRSRRPAHIPLHPATFVHEAPPRDGEVTKSRGRPNRWGSIGDFRGINETLAVAGNFDDFARDVRTRLVGL